MSKSDITEKWLRDSGFKWHQFDRQPDKHWLLWLGWGSDNRSMCIQDIGIELAPAWWQNRNGDDVGQVGSWHCWFRSDTAGRYHRFLHVRHVTQINEISKLVEAITGNEWNPDNHFYGNCYTPARAEQIRQDLERLDMRLSVGAPTHAKWLEVEKDDTRGRALPEHMEAQSKDRV